MAGALLPETRPDLRSPKMWDTIRNTIEDPSLTLYLVLDEAHRGMGKPSAASLSAKSTIVQRLINWGYISYDAVTLSTKDQPIATLRVWKGAQNEVKAGFASDLAIAVPKGRELANTYLQNFANDVASNGYLNRAVQRSGLRGTVSP